MSVLMLIFLLAAGPQTTAIEDTIYRPDGAKFAGVVTIRSKGFRAADGTDVPPQIHTLRILNGLLRVRLVPTAGSTPETAYRVCFAGQTDCDWWAVPVSSVPLRVGDVRTEIEPIPPPAVVAVRAEIPAGTVDGINAAFTLSVAPPDPALVLVFRNGLKQAHGVDYTITAAVITFLPASTPQAGDLLAAFFVVP